jgi:hypothetical protein
VSAELGASGNILDGEASKRAANTKLSACNSDQQHGNNSVLIGDSVSGNKNHHVPQRIPCAPLLAPKPNIARKG